MTNDHLPAKRRTFQGFIPLLLIAAIAFGIYTFLRPIPPAEFPQLAQFSGSLTVSHSNAIWGAQLNEHTAKHIVETLGQCRFKPFDSQPLTFEGDISMRFTPELLMELTQVDGETYARLTTPQSTGVYSLNKPVYEEIRESIYASFPNGVQVLELQPWWEEYFALACSTVLEKDFHNPKEISASAVVRYTFYQMVADGTAKEFEVTTKDGKTLNVIPYPLFLARAREYFADGAGPSIKQTYYFDAATDSFNFPAMEDSYYGSYPYGAYDDYANNGYYALQSLTRDLTGNITAVIADYNAVDFGDPGTLTQLHYLTMVSSSTGQYRFVSCRTQLANPMNVSLEGYFNRVSEVGSYSAEMAFENGLGQLGLMGDDLLLGTTRYSRGSAYLELLAFSPTENTVVAQRTIEAESPTVFLAVRALSDGVVVKTDHNVLLLDKGLNTVDTLELPSVITDLQPVSYGVSNDLSTLYYVDEEGLCQYQNDSRSLLLPHPQADIHAEGPIDMLRNPVCILDGKALLLTHTGKGDRLRYSILRLDVEQPSLYRMELEAPYSVMAEVQNEYMHLQSFDSSGPDERPTKTHHTVYSFRNFDYVFFNLPYDAVVPDSLIAGDSLYYFKQTQRDTPDVIFTLWRMDLDTLESSPLSVQISNAVPSLLGADAKGHVLFSYRSPMGSGFGITNPVNP